MSFAAAGNADAFSFHAETTVDLIPLLCTPTFRHWYQTRLALIHNMPASWIHDDEWQTWENSFQLHMDGGLATFGKFRLTLPPLNSLLSWRPFDSWWCMPFPEAHSRTQGPQTCISQSALLPHWWISSTQSQVPKKDPKKAEAKRLKNVRTNMAEVFNSWIRRKNVFLNSMNPHLHRFWVEESILFWNDHLNIIPKYSIRRSTAQSRKGKKGK